MLRIKRLYLYILQTFLPVFFMTFGISLFIILMQFLWKYVEDLVGKGLETHVLAELFLYAALTLVPMALPLAILLASLMSFGNLGERYELLAIKAAGISLLRAMRPLIVLIIFVCIGAFFFQNDIIPKINVKFRTLMISIKQKSPELDIPEGSFYSGIENYNIYVKAKDKETGTLREVMIYDVSKGFDNMAVIVCDSAKMKMSSNKDYLQLNLYNGQQFSNFKQSGLGDRSALRNDKFVPYSRENFKEKTVIIPFDANFNRMDEASMDGTQISKNVAQLRASVDSLTTIVDSLNINDRKVMLKYTYLSYRNSYENDTSKVEDDGRLRTSYSLDSVLNSLSSSEKISVYSEAMSRAEANKNDFMFRSISKIDTQKKIRQHNVELQRKFTLSFACLIFFFIGAPLGAIIRKGGLGMPVVVSVILFIIYYIIDNLGYKMARDGVWAVWQGVWLSSFILFPLGVFITYKAINDSALLNADAYRNYYVKLFGDRGLMNLNQLFSIYDKRAKYALMLFGTFLIVSLIALFSEGFIGSTFSVLQWITGILYVFLLIDIFATRQKFYSNVGEKIETSGIILNFTIGIPFYFVFYPLHKNKMKKILLSYKKQTEIKNV